MTIMAVDVGHQPGTCCAQLLHFRKLSPRDKDKDDMARREQRPAPLGSGALGPPCPFPPSLIAVAEARIDEKRMTTLSENGHAKVQIASDSGKNGKN